MYEVGLLSGNNTTYSNFCRKLFTTTALFFMLFWMLNLGLVIDNDFRCNVRFLHIPLPQWQTADNLVSPLTFYPNCSEEVARM